jgi:hypothetical protein
VYVPGPNGQELKIGNMNMWKQIEENKNRITILEKDVEELKKESTERRKEIEEMGKNVAKLKQKYAKIDQNEAIRKKNDVYNTWIKKESERIQ